MQVFFESVLFYKLCNLSDYLSCLVCFITNDIKCWQLDSITFTDINIKTYYVGLQYKNLYLKMLKWTLQYTIISEEEPCTQYVSGNTVLFSVTL